MDVASARAIVEEMIRETPDYLFIDTILFSYRLGKVRHDEQKIALVAAARAATDAITFLTALENFGVERRSALHAQAGKFLASPFMYRKQYPGMIGLRREGETAESFLAGQYALFLVEPLLTDRQYQSFSKAYWWFVHNHQPEFYHPKKGRHIGAYATEPKDNASTLPRFEGYMNNIVNHSNQRIRQQFEDFPLDIVLAVLKRAFL